EVMDQGSLVGGLYGLKLGSIFFGESMFSRTTNASKFALHALCRGDVFVDLTLIDRQMPSEHLSALGMSLISRGEFEQALQTAISPVD
ncbi:MAG: leucyl/phenylalanyl-tRNA--protein transferase, partial [Halieaceae bacterium]|nr:leucyl/phenylalanyl-tRNA--protein transferase [Halieaceae bacterium]